MKNPKAISERVHNNMSRIRGKNTKPEMIVRKYLWKNGFRYRVNNPRLPGHPDVVLRRYRTCIFVNGCFWHGHDNCMHFKLPKSHMDFWKQKIMRNKQRDIDEQHQLARMGGHCITVWECELTPSRREATLNALAFTLNHIFLKDNSRTYKPLEEEPECMEQVAERLK